MRRKRGQLTLTLSLSFLFLLLPFRLRGVEVSFILAGGFSNSSFNLVNRSLEGWAEKINREASLAGWEINQGSRAQLKNGIETELGVLVRLSSRFAFSLSSGFVHFELSEKDTSQVVKKEAETYVYSRPTKASAIPFSLSLFYFHPLNANLRLYLKAGGGLLFGRYIDREANRRQVDLKYVYPTYQNATATSPLLQAGGGLHFQPEASMGFFIEFSYRLVRMTAFEGRNKAGAQGPLEYYEEYLPQFDFWQPRVVILTTEPDPQLIRSKQRAVVDFSGFSAKIGITAKF